MHLWYMFDVKVKSQRVRTAPARPIRMAPLSVSEDERAAIQRAALAAGMTVAQWLRLAVAEKLKREGK